MRLRNLLALVAVAFLAAPAAAQTVYTYTGNLFDDVSPPYTTAMRLTGNFTVASPLPAGATTDLSATVLAFSFFDGVETRTDVDSLVCGFEVTTDGAGMIVEWDILFRQATVPAMSPQHDIQTRSLPLPNETLDRGGFSPTDVGCGPTVLDPFGQVTFNPGTWTSAPVAAPAASIPTASTVGLAVLMLLLAGFGAWRVAPRG